MHSRSHGFISLISIKTLQIPWNFRLYHFFSRVVKSIQKHDCGSANNGLTQHGSAIPLSTSCPKWFSLIFHSFILSLAASVERHSSWIFFVPTSTTFLIGFENFPLSKWKTKLFVFSCNRSFFNAWLQGKIFFKAPRSWMFSKVNIPISLFFD